jgi:hypothetical protein
VPEIDYDRTGFPKRVLESDDPRSLVCVKLEVNASVIPAARARVRIYGTADVFEKVIGGKATCYLALKVTMETHLRGCHGAIYGTDWKWLQVSTQTNTTYRFFQL